MTTNGDTALPPQAGEGCCFERINCALEVSGVEHVQSSGFDSGNAALMLDLLTITVQDGHMTFIFAGDGKIRLKLGDWRLRIEDFGEPWPTKHIPCHPT